jgi:hypothetical protein
MNLTRSYHRRFFATLFFIVGFLGCKKADESPSPSPAVKELSTDNILKQAQSIFEQNDYHISLFDPLIKQKNLKTQWQPQWKDARRAIQVNSKKYFYIPIKESAEDPISVTGARVYLLAVADSSKTALYETVYIADKVDVKKLVEQTPESEEAFFRAFTGALVMTNLSTKRQRVIPYEYGRPVQDTDINQSASKTNGTATTHGTNATVCGYWTVCYWSTTCTASSSTTEARIFGVITYARPDGGTSHGSCQYPANIQRPVCTSLPWTLTESNVNYQCQTVSDGDDEFAPPPTPTPYTPPSVSPMTPNYVALIQSTLLNNPNALMLPCAGLTDAWLPIIQFRPPQSVRDKLDYLSSTGFVANWYPYYVQDLKGAQGPSINLDRFAIQFPTLPTIGGQQLTMQQTLDHIRLNISTYSGTTFAPQIRTGQNEANTWYSANPMGTVVRIDISAFYGIFRDGGDVIVSDYGYTYNSSYWKFSTIHDPFSDDHPVSGTREFGIRQIPTGYEFYTMGADRLTGYGDSLIGYISDVGNSGKDPFQFDGGRELWENLTHNLQIKLFNPQNIPTTIPQPVVNHPDFSQLQYILNNNMPLSNLDC